MTNRLVMATEEESALLFDLWRLAYVMTDSGLDTGVPRMGTVYDLAVHVTKMLDAGFIVPEVVEETT